MCCRPVDSFIYHVFDINLSQFLQLQDGTKCICINLSELSNSSKEVWHIVSAQKISGAAVFLFYYQARFQSFGETVMIEKHRAQVSAALSEMR